MNPESKIDPFKMCLFLVQRGMKAMGSDLPVAEKALGAASEAARRAPQDQTEHLSVLVTCYQALLEEAAGRAAVAKELRERAMSLVDAIAPEKQPELFNHFMLTALYNLKEYWRAVRFCEQVIMTSIGSDGPDDTVELLAMEGLCYLRTGLKEEAAVPLRAALKILRKLPGHPRLSQILIDLGNAIRNSDPKEAEELFKQAASLHESKGQLESATFAWVNLGGFYGEQGRYAESIDYFQRALQVIEGTPGASPARIGIPLNNLACSYQKMREFDQAMPLVNRAIDLLAPTGGGPFAAACATKGEILHDMGRHEEAVEWLQRSYSERQKFPNPNADSLAHNLELEIESLRSLGREEDARIAEDRLSAVKKMRENAPRAKLNVASINGRHEASVLIELNIGRHSNARYGIRDADVVGDQIAAILEAQKLGSYHGRVVIPESTTLIFRGQDGEGMFAAMEQFLTDHSIFAGATVSVRQGTVLRELVLPQTVN